MYGRPSDPPVNSDFPRPIITELEVALRRLETTSKENPLENPLSLHPNQTVCIAKHISITSSGENDAMVLLIWR